MKILKGIPSAGGMVHAVMAVVKEKKSHGTEEVTLELAVESCVKRVRSLYEKTKKEVNEESADIFRAYEMLLTDEYLLQSIRKRVEKEITLKDAVTKVLNEQAAVFAKAKNEYMKQRADDIHNIKEMLIQALENSQKEVLLPENAEKFILAAESLSPADTMSLDTKRLAGLVTHLGGTTSHVVILAKMLGIPAVTGVDKIDEILAGQAAVLDGGSGELIINPDDETVNKVTEWQKEDSERQKMYKSIPKGDVKTLDSETVHVSINIGTAKELETVEMDNIRGVGLYRTEFMFSERETVPTVEEQTAEYRRIFQALGDKELVVRTIDIGGDKKIPYLDLPKEDNPFLGCRGIRLCFRYENLLREQLEALLIASDGKPFSIMFPMINSVEEFLRAKKIWNEVKEISLKKGRSVNENIQIGVMIETPSAAVLSDILVNYVDFASVGTNDLTQYFLAADRGNPNVGTDVSYKCLALVRILKHIISVFIDKGVKISVCGEAGSDENFLKYLIGMGLRYTSVSVSMVDRIRYAIVNTDAKKMKKEIEAKLEIALRTGKFTF